MNNPKSVLTLCKSQGILPFLIGLISIFFYHCSDSDDGIEPELHTATLSSTTVSDISTNSVTVNSSVINNGNSTILEHGFVWSTESNPTVDDNVVTDFEVNGDTYTATIKDLDPNTEYFVKAFAKNNVGISYGDEIGFTTDHFIYEGDIHLKTQSEIDDFGEMGYTYINGNLDIGSSTTILSYQPSINSLEGLSTITAINGLLRISWVNNLVSLKGLENISSLGALYLIRVDKLKNLDELLNVTSFEHESLISFIGINDSLTNIDGLKNVTKINSRLEISSNNNLENIDGLMGLTSIGQDLIIQGNPKLENIDGLANLVDFDQDLSIRGNVSLTNLDGLSKITTVNFLLVSDNENLDNINGLNNISSVGFGCTFLRNTSLKDFCVFQSIISNSNEFEFITSENLYNPSKQDVIEGNCSQ
ncbi:fibronectin type III domain-containing protein [Muricauda sp. SCSIO 64092]|uniref:fibronectin type III domain-containing protein n=1 Tax=Allomuricauda sp. SCSIO 64092 TaxID=2908842 RepID=UPI001FF2BE5F|nr:fibronectin type III domain-containing protein [Muricauda sp. SCSIO 64092]UOY06819.1 fibronectin type III domain-containing protein [Muricauda sp. SCSIO 64092]